VSARGAVWLSEPEVPVKTTLALPGKRGRIGGHAGGQSTEGNADGAGKTVDRSRGELNRLPGSSYGEAERRRSDGQRKVWLRWRRRGRWSNHSNGHRSGMREAAGRPGQRDSR
jgi:hypothetical protein